MRDLAGFQAALGYEFHNPALLCVALTHPSSGEGANYQRLEFLGDAVAQLIVSEALYALEPELPEGELTFRRARLVCARSLAGAARLLKLPEYIRMSAGGEREGGRDNDSILCDVMESLLAAVYLDGGYQAARGLLLGALGGIEAPGPGARDAKSNFQELAQSRGLTTPTYVTLASGGPAHKRRFASQAMIAGEVLGEGEGLSKKAAEQQAARAALARLNHSESV